MHKTYAIVNADNDQVVDVVDGLPCAIGCFSIIANKNPEKRFYNREATRLESRYAHIFQRYALASFVLE